MEDLKYLEAKIYTLSKENEILQQNINILIETLLKYHTITFKDNNKEENIAEKINKVIEKINEEYEVNKNV